MTSITTQNVRMQMRAYIDSVALNIALETGLFWQLAERPQTAAEIAQALDIPLYRSGAWLDMLAGLGYLRRKGDRYAPSDATSGAILEAFSVETWMHLAEEERYRFPFGVDLAQHMRHPLSVWAGQSRMPHDYLRSIAEDAGFARRFTHMLYELHLSLADAVAATLDLRNVERIMDLGGGSGVISLAILREKPGASAVVIDHPHVCAAGRAIVAGRSEGTRLTFLPGDFTHDDLPEGYDLALECDVGVYSETIFRRVWGALKPGGRLVIIDEFPTSLREDDAQQRRYAFYRAMTDFPVADHMRTSIAQVQAMLARAGFRLSVERSLPDGMVIIQGTK